MACSQKMPTSVGRHALTALRHTRACCTLNQLPWIFVSSSCGALLRLRLQEATFLELGRARALCARGKPIYAFGAFGAFGAVGQGLSRAWCACVCLSLYGNLGGAVGRGLAEGIDFLEVLSRQIIFVRGCSAEPQPEQLPSQADLVLSLVSGEGGSFWLKPGCNQEGVALCSAGS